MHESDEHKPELLDGMLLLAIENLFRNKLKDTISPSNQESTASDFIRRSTMMSIRAQRFQEATTLLGAWRNVMIEITAYLNLKLNQKGVEKKRLQIGLWIDQIADSTLQKHAQELWSRAQAARTNSPEVTALLLTKIDQSSKKLEAIAHEFHDFKK